MNATTGKLDEYQLVLAKKRRDEIISLIVAKLAPRRSECYWPREPDMRMVGRCLGHLQAVAELQALIEVSERGPEAKEQILSELDSPPFKKVPDGWTSPCLDYIGQRLNSRKGYPALSWPFSGGSVSGGLTNSADDLFVRQRTLSRSG